MKGLISLVNLLPLKLEVTQIWNTIWPILLSLLFFGFIILIHEFGHFITAKLFKVKVNEFAIGMGPAIFKKQKGETLYALRLFPVGGYVSMEGEDKNSDAEGSFSSKKVWQRFIIIAAGAIMNLILGFILVAILTGQSRLIGTRYVNTFMPNSVSQQFGLEEGDEILKINGTNIYSASDISYSFSRSINETNKYSVIKDNKKVQIDGTAFDIQVKRNGEKTMLNNVVFETTKEQGLDTIVFDFYIVGVEKTVKNVIVTTFRDTVSYARLVWLSLFDLVTGRFGLKDLSGPVGTVKLVAGVISDAATTPQVQKVDLTPMWTIMAFITINIGIFNLLPIPALDGGRLFFLLIELVRRKPIPAKYEGLVHGIGLGLLLLFMIIITFNDIVNIIKG